MARRWRITALTVLAGTLIGVNDSSNQLPPRGHTAITWTGLHSLTVSMQA